MNHVQFVQDPKPVMDFMMKCTLCGLIITPTLISLSIQKISLIMLNIMILLLNAISTMMDLLTHVKC